MRTWLPALALLITAAGCGKKSTPAPAADPTPIATEAPAPEPEPEPEEPAAPVPNADFNASLTRADGSVVSGHVMRVERGTDWYAEDGWTDEESKLTLTVETDSTMEDVTWDKIASVSIKYGGRDAIDCQYDSTFTPWMYMCVIRTTTTAKDTAGKSWRITTRNKWKFTFDDGSEVEFYVYKLPIRRQDTKTMGLDSVENYELYGELQAEAMQATKGSAVTKITLSK